MVCDIALLSSTTFRVILGSIFLSLKSETFEIFKGFVNKIENENSLKVIKIRSDHGGEFINADIESFCFENGYSHNFSAPRTP